MSDSFNIHNYFKRGKTVVLTLRHGEEEIRQWMDKDVVDLLKLMKIFHLEFQNPRRKKKEVWDDVANELYKSGYTWSSEDCRKKWSNMIRTFKAIEETRNEPGYDNKKLKCPYYDSMLHLLTLENAEAFPEAVVVVQMLNKELTNRASGGTSTSRKGNYKIVENYAKCPTQHQQIQMENLQNASQFLDSQRDRDDDSINLVSEADLMNMGVSLTGHHDTLVSEVQTGGVSGMESSIIFTQAPRFKTHSSDVIVPQSSTTTTFHPHISSINKASLAVRANRRPLKRKRGSKDNKVEESMDAILSKFIESTNRQNEHMLEKMTSFHENALALMQERNGILRDIRDSLISEDGVDQGESLVNTCHDAVGHNEDPQRTLTLHVGPAFSINASNELASSATQLNSTLVLSNSTATIPSSALSSFQLPDGTVLSTIDGTQENKTVLSHLNSFAQSVLPDVSLLHPHSSLVSAVTDDNGESSTDMTLAMQNAITD